MSKCTTCLLGKNGKLSRASRLTVVLSTGYDFMKLSTMAYEHINAIAVIDDDSRGFRIEYISGDTKSTTYCRDCSPTAKCDCRNYREDIR